MTDEQLKELERLASEATPGPWNWDSYDHVCCPMVRPEDLGNEVCCVSIESQCRYADGLFIAASRTAIPALVAEVLRLRAALEKDLAK